MRAVMVMAFGLAAMVATPVLAAERKTPTPAPATLDACALQGLAGHGYTIATGNTCWQVTGGVDVSSSWGNTEGGDGGPGGQLIVQTPAGDYTLPAPRH